MKSIKTWAAVVIAALTLCLTGCKKDDEDLIIGSWDLVNYEYISVVTGYTGEMAEMNGTYSEIEELEPGTSLVLTFNKDNTTTIAYTENGRTESHDGTYSIKDNQISLLSDGVTETYTIEKLDKDNLSLGEHDSYDDTEDGQHAHVDITMKINFKKK